MKTAVIVMSDPKTESEVTLGRVFNALATAYDIKQRGDDVLIQFHGAGTRWVGHLTQADHPAHALFEQVKDKVAGVSCGCADVFGGRDDAEKNGFDLITENKVPGTSGLPSVGRLVAEGYSVVTF